MTNSFPKSQRLCGKTTIDAVVNSGLSISHTPFRCQYKLLSIPLEAPVQIAFAVPKRNKPRAVDRNKIKRRMREAYRKNKQELLAHCTTHNQQLGLLWIYTAKEILDYATIEIKTKELLAKVLNAVSHA